MRDHDNQLTPAGIFQIAWEIREGEADPEEVRVLLEYYCNLVDNRQPIPSELLAHLRDAFRAFLRQEKTIDSALGLARKKGRPKADEKSRKQMATEVLRCRLGGMSHQNALAKVAADFGWVVSIVGEAWAAWAPDALILLRLERYLDQYPWTPDEVERLTEIFRTKPWFIAPKNSPTKPA